MPDTNPSALLTHGNEVIRMWHKNFGRLKQIQNHSMVEGLLSIKTSSGIWKVCIVEKHPEKKIDREKENRATSNLGLIHSDISGPIPTTSMICSRYVITFIDDFSRFIWVFFLKKKYEVP